MKQPLQQKAKKFFKHTYLLRLLISKNIKNQYYRSVLGVFWTLLNPLLHMLVLAFVFGSMFGLDTRGGLDFPVYIMSGNLIFGLMLSGTNGALSCFVNQRGMLQKTKVSISIFPTSNVLSALVSMGFSMIALIIVMLIRIPYGARFYVEMLMVVLMLPSLFFFTLGLSYILAPTYVFFRDIKHIYSVITQLWRFLTPIFYPISRITSEKVLFVIKLNPLYHYVEYFRTTLIGEVPSLLDHAICYGYGIAMLLVGILVLRLTKNKIVSRL